MKVKTRKAFKRSQGLPSPRGSQELCVIRFTWCSHRLLGHAWSRRRDSYTVTKSMELNTGFGKRMFQISNRPPKPQKLSKNEKSYAAAVRRDPEARQCKEQNRCTMLGLSPPCLTQSLAGKGSRKNLSIQLDCTAYESEGFRPTQSVWSLL